MAKKIEDYRKEKVTDKYRRFRATLKNLCEEFGVPHEELMQNYPEEAAKMRVDIELSGLITSMNEMMAKILKKYCFEQWAKVVGESFDVQHQKSVSDLVGTMVSSDAANAYAKMTLATLFLNELNDESKREGALNSLREYCATHSIEEMENNYGIARYSKHRRIVNQACKEGFARNRKVNRGYVEALFHVSSKMEKEAVQSEPCL